MADNDDFYGEEDYEEDELQPAAHEDVPSSNPPAHLSEHEQHARPAATEEDDAEAALEQLAAGEHAPGPDCITLRASRVWQSTCPLNIFNSAPHLRTLQRRAIIQKARARMDSLLPKSPELST